MVRRFRLHEAAQQVPSPSSVFACELQPEFNASPPRPRQLIVAVSANVAEFGDSLGDGFDCVCPKPLSRGDLTGVVMSYISSKMSQV